MARPVTIGLLNVLYKTETLEARRCELLRLVNEAGQAGCQIVLLPEFADHHRTKESLASHAQGKAAHRQVVGMKLDSSWLHELSALARKYGMVVIPDVLLNEDGRWFNSAVVYGPGGEILGQYRKTHIAPGENDLFEAGQVLAPIATPFGKIGLFICYDINFPEVTRCYELQEADLLLWTTMRQAENEEGLYRAVLPALAITHGLPLGVATYVSETQHNERNPMSSILYNCFGQTVAGGLLRAGVVRGTVDLDEHPLERRSWDTPEWVNSPSYLRRQRRPELYKSLHTPLSDDERNMDNEKAR